MKYQLFNSTYPQQCLYVLSCVGTSVSRRLFEQSMRHGHVDTITDKMMMYGSAGVGKTCTMKIVAGEKPPDVRTSTPLATRPATTYQLLQMSGKWISYKSKDKMRISARISKTSIGRQTTKTLYKLRRKMAERVRESQVQDLRVNLGDSETTASDHQQPAGGASKGQELPTLKTESSLASRSLVNPNVREVIHAVLDEMFQLIDECPDNEEPLTFIHKILVSDCGGQPQFHELLPIFLRKMSLIMIVFKLSEKFSSRPKIEYYVNGKAVGTPYESHLTVEQLIEHGLTSIHSHCSSKDAGQECEAPKIVIIGTHKDEEHKCSESRKEKNKKLITMFSPEIKKQIVYYKPGENEVLFPMNAKCPSEAESEMALSITSKLSTENRSDIKQLPLQWLSLEIMLEEISLRLKRGILSRNECLEVSYRLHLDESALDAALIYLDELSLVFYYPGILSEVIFTDPQVLLDKISELVKVHHDKSKTCKGDDWRKFYSHALVTVKFLDHEEFSGHYAPGLFEVGNLVVLFLKLHVFATFSESEYFVPALLRHLDRKALDEHRLNSIPSLVLQFPDDCPGQGIFCGLLCWLVSRENDFPVPWSISVDDLGSPLCLYRNCVKFDIPDSLSAVTLIDTYTHFEVHADVPEEFPVIKKAIEKGLHKAALNLHYSECRPKSALLCPCGRGESHVAEIVRSTHWKCSLRNVSKKYGELNHEQQLWLKASSATEKKYQISESHLPLLLSKLNNHACRWRDIGMHLGFLHGELDNIQAKPLLLNEGPKAWLREMLGEWLQWAPGDSRGSSSVALVDTLKVALNNSGLAATALEIESCFH